MPEVPIWEAGATTDLQLISASIAMSLIFTSMLLVSLEKCVYYRLSNTINLAQESLGEKQVFLDAKPCDFRISLNR